jgi:uncharacterized protein YgbK (DUF1537 family)
MIAAIADDLTGATEIAGLGWRHGLSADVLHRDEEGSDAELVVFDSDSRLCSSAEAQRRVRRIARRLKVRSPEWIFKKVDSVLRGNVLAEIEALLDTLELPRCILSPANPSGERVIRQGRYFIQDTPLDRTDFRHDPHYPRRSSRVLALLKEPQSHAIVCQSRLLTLPESGIIVAEAERFRDALTWARGVDEGTFPAGGGDFFHALLRVRGHSMRRRQALERHDPTLFICGSLADATTKFISRCQTKGWPVLPMPARLRQPRRVHAASLASWVRSITAALQNHSNVVMGIGSPRLAGEDAPRRLGTRLIAAVSRVLRRSAPRTVCVEGGATTAALTVAEGWKRFTVEHEWNRGVTAVRPQAHDALLLVCKPGSYSWPPEFVK